MAVAPPRWTGWLRERLSRFAEENHKFFRGNVSKSILNPDESMYFDSGKTTAGSD